MARLPKEISPQASDAIHRALLTGLLANVGRKTDTHEFNGARGAKFSIFPGSVLFKRNTPWVMAAELVETTRLYARTVASVRPEWIERAAPHLIRRIYSDPTWNPESGHVQAMEKVSLYSLVIVPSRRVHYGPIDPRTSRELFIHHALMLGEFHTHAEFFQHNLRLLADVAKMEAKTRLKGLAAEDKQRFKFFDARIPPDVYSGPLFERWRREVEAKTPRLLFMGLSDVMASGAEPASAQLYPDEIRIGGMTFPLDYVHDTGSAVDGVTANIPIAALGQAPAERFEWLIPGYLPQRIEDLTRSLPKELRKTFIPIGDTAREAAAALSFGEGSLLEGLALFLGKRAGTVIPPESFNEESLSPYLRMNFRVRDAAGKQLAIGRDLAKLRADLQVEVRSSFVNSPQSEHDRDNLTRWDFGDLPDRVPVRRHGMTLWGYPALIDRGASVSIRLMESVEASHQATRAGARRLFMIQLEKEIEYISRHIPHIQEMALNYSTVGGAEELRKDLLSAIVDRALFYDGEPVLSQTEFIRRATDGWRRLTNTAAEIGNLANEILAEYQAIQREIGRAFPSLMQPAARDMREQIKYLIYRGFLTSTPFEALSNMPRYLRAISARLRKLLNAGLARDTAAMEQVEPWWMQYKERGEHFRRLGRIDRSLGVFRWMIEEFRVSLFAQELKTPAPISAQRLQRAWEQVPIR